MQKNLLSVNQDTCSYRIQTPDYKLQELEQLGLATGDCECLFPKHNYGHGSIELLAFQTT